MPEGMSEVEEGPITLLALVAPHDFRFDLARPADHACQGRGIARQQLLDMRFQPAEEFDIADKTVLDDLGEPGPQLTRRQSGQGMGVRDDRPGLMESTDQILAAGMIDPGLAADR